MANMEQRVSDALQERAGVTSAELAKSLSLERESVRYALERLRDKGIVEAVETYGVMFYFAVRNVVRPKDGRDGRNLPRANAIVTEK